MTNYGHFTSPIRRYVDCYNHLLMHNIIYDTDLDLVIDLEKFNETNKLVKRATRAFDLIKLEEDVKTKGDRGHRGYIYMIRDNFMAYIYIKKLKMTLKKQLA